MVDDPNRLVTRPDCSRRQRRWLRRTMDLRDLVMSNKIFPALTNV